GSYIADAPGKFPNFQISAAALLEKALGNHRYLIKNAPFTYGSEQLDIFRVGPHQGCGRAGWTSQIHEGGRQIRSVPHLFRKHASLSGEIFHGSHEWRYVSTSRQLIVRALSSQQWPCTPYTPSLIRAAVGMWTVTVIVIATPNGAHWRLDLEHSINDTKRVL